MPKSGFRKLFRNATPVPFSTVNQSVYSLSGFSDTSVFDLYMSAYQQSGTVRGIVGLNAESVSGVEWRLYRKNNTDGRVRYTTTDQGSDMRTEVVQHQALKVLNSPNPFMTRMNLMETSQISLDLTGECWWVITKTANIPTGVWPMRPSRMTVVPDPVNFIKGYYYTDDNGQKWGLTVDDIVFVKYPNPLDYYRGASPIQAILPDIEGIRLAAEYNRNFFYNGADPGGVIQVDQRLSDDEWNEMMNRWRESHRGVSRAHVVTALEQGATWVPNSRSQKDMDFVNLMGISRDKIREPYRIGKVMLGQTDDVNRANAQTAQEVYSAWNVVPSLKRWREAFNYQYLPMFGSTSASVEFDFVPPMPVDREADAKELESKTKAAQVLVDAGYDPHDVLEVIGLPDMNVVEKAVQAPALPPGWVPGQQPAPGQPAQPATAQPQEADGEGNDAENN